MPVEGCPLPEGRRWGYAVLSDGSFVIEHQRGVYRATVGGELTLHSYDSSVRHLAPGPAPAQLWCSAGEHVLLATLEPDKLVVARTHALKPGETLLHLAAAGARQRP